jgi:hypothetical protein
MQKRRQRRQPGNAFVAIRRRAWARGEGAIGRKNAVLHRESFADCWTDKWLFFLDLWGARGRFYWHTAGESAICGMARKPIGNDGFMGRDTEILILYGRRFLSRKSLERNGLTGIYRNTARDSEILCGTAELGFGGYGDVSGDSHGPAFERHQGFALLVVCAKRG